jgi:uncharacterized protein YbgA (DUF1722 family)/uncharacterized protein YbbK (DUF523 family)
MDKFNIGISSCLLGNKVRYDGGHTLDSYVTETLGQYFTWVPVCPEIEYGLPVPRETMRLTGTPASPRLVTVRTGVDHTEGMIAWAMQKLQELEKEELCGFIFKSKSPSSGMGGVKVYSDDGVPSKKGVGLFAGAFIRHFPLLPVIDEGRLHDPSLRENFLERVFVYQRWRKLIQTGATIKNLVPFHTHLKYLILAHSPRHYSALGKLVAEGKKHSPDKLFAEYIRLLMEGLVLIATVKKNTNVLLHIAGYFKHQLTQEEKHELLESIEQYHQGFIPLIVPIVLLRHYIRQFQEPYLNSQYYLDPHPVELMLRNHA